MLGIILLIILALILCFIVPVLGIPLLVIALIVGIVKAIENIANTLTGFKQIEWKKAGLGLLIVLIISLIWLL